MNTEEFGRILHEMYSRAADGGNVAMIHLFGIKYAAQINESHTKASQITRASGIPVLYIAEVSKGIKLAKFGVPK